MHAALENICNSLDSLRERILSGTAEERTLAEFRGWNTPPLTKHDLADIVGSLANKIRVNEIDELENSEIAALSLIPKRIEVFKAHNLPQMYTGNANQAIPTFFALVAFIKETLEPLYSWEILQEHGAIPNQIAKRLRSIKRELDSILISKDQIEKEIKMIQDGAKAADMLPVDLESLSEVRTKIDKISTDASEIYGKIDAKKKEIEEVAKSMKEKQAEATKLVSQASEAYRVTTSTGLAAAFTERARNLSFSMWGWVVLLLIALITGACIGSVRFDVITTSLKDKMDAGHIWIQIFLSVLSLGAPIWFAWLSTKQIAQRFKLSEDYAFKASVARAYEGYRREAARIDKDFEKQLFGSALTRLDEAPLRFVENENHGSPYHEFLSSPHFLKAIENIPELKERFIKIFKSKGEKFTITGEPAKGEKTST